MGVPEWFFILNCLYLPQSNQQVKFPYRLHEFLINHIQVYSVTKPRSIALLDTGSSTLRVKMLWNKKLRVYKNPSVQPRI